MREVGSALPVTASNNYLLGMGTLRHMSFYSYMLHFLLVSHLNRKICLSLNQGLFQMQKKALHRRISAFSYRGGLLQWWATSLPATIPDLDLWARGQHTPECGGRENWKLSMISPAKLIEHVEKRTSFQGCGSLSVEVSRVLQERPP